MGGLETGLFVPTVLQSATVSTSVLFHRRQNFRIQYLQVIQVYSQSYISALLGSTTQTAWDVTFMAIRWLVWAVTGILIRVWHFPSSARQTKTK
ncbi:hypothetical protein CPB86DRAFT_783597 [Serendipita vermifera]|nr:hypothetical protein CPB86DRAFT_783597 [Serendipita vermifera]